MKKGRIFLVALLLFFEGCGGNKSAESSLSFTEEAILKANQLFATQEKMATLKKRQQSLRGKLPLAERALAQSQKKLEQLEAQYQALDQADQQTFEDFMEMAGKEDTEVVKQSAERFLRAYPLSPYADQVRPLLLEFQQKFETLQEKKAEKTAAQQAQMEAERQAHAAKFRAGEMTAFELKAYLGGKSQAEIIKLLGKPRSRRSDIWSYPGAHAVNSQGEHRGINIFFNGGRVVSVGLRSR